MVFKSLFQQCKQNHIKFHHCFSLVVSQGFHTLPLAQNKAIIIIEISLLATKISDRN